MEIPEYSAIVLENSLIAKETRGLRVRVKSDGFHFTPGQFLSLKIQDKVFRAYSIASSPTRLPELELCVKILPNGLGGQYIDHLVPGDEVVFRGAFGHFGIRQPEKPTLLIATGTGIAPMKSIFEKKIEEKEKIGKIEIIFGVRDAECASYIEEFRRRELELPHFSLELCVSRPQGEGKWTVGRVTQSLFQKPKEFFEGKEILLCGNPPMIKEVTQILLEKGVVKENIVSESF